MNFLLYRLCLVSTESWIKCPHVIVLGFSCKTFAVSVDPCELPPGLHVGFVNVFEDGALQRGVLFRLPITVTKPELLPPHNVALTMNSLSFDKEERFRKFFLPPAGCSFLDITIKDGRLEGEGDNSPRLLVIHGIQLFPGVPYRDNEKKVFLIRLFILFEIWALTILRRRIWLCCQVARRWCQWQLRVVCL